jgi:hypothetical protein
MEVADPFKIFVVVQQTTWYHIPEEHNCDSHYSENLRSPLVIQMFMVEEHKMADGAL